jgi:hypothetical protein
LNAQEFAILDFAIQSFRTTMQRLQASQTAITSGKTALQDSDRAALQRLLQERDQEVVRRATQVLGSVRPETALRLRKPGQMISDLRKAQGR